MPALQSCTPVHFTTPVIPAARVLHQIRVTTADRTTLQRELGLSQASITRHVAALINAGLVEETHRPVDGDVRTGRPRTRLGLDGRHATVWAAHIGVRSTEIVISDLAGRVIGHERLELDIPHTSPAEALSFVSTRLESLAGGIEPTNVGLAFSAHVDAGGRVTSDVYRWQEEDVAALFPYPVTVATGVSAMAGTEIINTPLHCGPEPSTLYFYAREVVAHAWIFNGAVHRPNSGRTPLAFHGMAPLSNSQTLAEAYRRGVHARSLTELVHLAHQNPTAREVLDERATALGHAVTAAVDLVDPDAVVFAGEAFTMDPAGLRMVVEHLRSSTASKGQLRIQRADAHILRTAAIQVALHPIRQDPVGSQLRHDRP